MRWEEVQERFPNEWVILEATKAHPMEATAHGRSDCHECGLCAEGFNFP
jgi:hypothetical protein